MARLKVSVGHDLATELGDDRDAVLHELADRTGASVYLRGNELTLEGEDPAVDRARAMVEELSQLVVQGISIGPQTVEAVAGVLTADGRAVDVLHDVVWRHRGQRVSPKTLGQKAYVDAIRANTVTFGIGPAGTGKTYLAIALAVAALSERGSRGSSSPGPPSRPASGWASCPATCRPRSTRTCDRCSTPCTTCWTPTSCSATSTRA